LFAAVLAAVVSVACSTLVVAEGDTSILKATAEKFWAARVAGDWRTVLAMLSATERQNVSVEAYEAAQALRYVSAEVMDVAVEGERGFVAVVYSAVVSKFPELPAKSVQRWEPWRHAETGWIPVPQDKLEAYPRRPLKAMPAADVTALTERARQFWEARVAQDAAAMYERLDPSSRGRYPREQFVKAKAQYLFSRFNIDWVEVIDTRGRVRVTYSAKPSDPLMSKLDPRELSETESWVKVDGEWYRAAQEQGTSSGK
jgi:hypothetical protein